MLKKKLLLGLVLFIIGLIGVASTLTMDFSLPAEAEALLKDRFTDRQIKLLLMINPSILLLFSLVIGTVLFDRAKLTVPLIEKLVGLKTGAVQIADIIKFGVLGGILAGVLLSLVALFFDPILPEEFKELGESIQPTLAARFLYGGFTEEILLRFGFMTLVVWITAKIVGKTKPVVYWTGILVAAVVFAFGHFPVAFQAVDNPSGLLLFYILIGNTIGGIIFGWLYWKKGLESAFLAHIFAHVVMVLAEPLVG